MPDPFKRCAMVWSAQTDQIADDVWPLVPRLHPMMDCTASQQAAHAVSNDDQAPGSMRCRPEGVLKQLGERLAIGGDVQAAVVAQEKWFESERLSQGKPMVVTASRPVLLIHAQAMNHEQQSARGVGRVQVDCIWRFTCRRLHRIRAMQAHARGERVMCGVKIITQDAIECRKTGGTL